MFGLNFIENKDNKNKFFMLLCGFEKFDNYFVRIDILERLFVQIINTNTEKGEEIKMNSDMLNLLGCSKNNFKKLLKNMGYRIFEKENDIFFKYNPPKNFKKTSKKVAKENPFGVLKNLNLG
jgi:ATP-dependent RNA helicase SUPV3L1/SUV3